MFQLASSPVSFVPAGRVGAQTIAGGYTMIPQKYYHSNPARNALGLVGGNEVSMATGNLVDVESDLRGVTRDLSKVPARQYQPTAGTQRIVFTERPTNRVVSVSTAPRHLATTQYVSYPGVPAPEQFVQEVYGAPWRF